MAKIDIHVQAEQVQARINELIAAGENMTPAWQAVGNMLVNRIRMGFRLGRDPWGNPWKPIKWRAPRVVMKSMKVAGPAPKGGKAPTKLVRTNKLTKFGEKQFAANIAALNGTGAAGQPLVDTGALRRSITAQATNDGVTVGTNLIYARVHQFGDVITPKRRPFLVFPGPSGMLIFSRRSVIPPRPYMPITASGELSLPATWAKNIVQTLAAHFKLGRSTSVPA